MLMYDALVFIHKDVPTQRIVETEQTHTTQAHI